MSFFCVLGTLPQLIASLGVPSQGVELFEVWLISDSVNELVDRFLENHINPLSCPVLVINRIFLSLFELFFSLESRTCILST